MLHLIFALVLSVEWVYNQQKNIPYQILRNSKIKNYFHWSSEIGILAWIGNVSEIKIHLKFNNLKKRTKIVFNVLRLQSQAIIKITLFFLVVVSLCLDSIDLYMSLKCEYNICVMFLSASCLIFNMKTNCY